MSTVVDRKYISLTKVERKRYFTGENPGQPRAKPEFDGMESTPIVSV